MKVKEVGPGRTTDSIRRRKEAGKGGEFAAELKDAMAATEPGAAVESPPVTAADSLLAVQEVPDAASGQKRRETRQYGQFLLDRLDDVQLALLTGSMPKDRLAELAQAIRRKRRRSDDPRLNEILDEIELRAEVEIAKLTRPVGS